MGLKISIRTVPKEQMRNAGLGDYFLGPDGWLMIQVVDLGDWKKEAALAQHELSEFFSVLNKGISILEIDKFDINYEGDGEPGDDPKAPYHLDHIFGNFMEQETLKQLGVNEKEYADSLPDL